MNNSVIRALAMLELLAGEKRPLRLSEIGRATGVPKSTALSILKALVNRGFAEGDASGYRLGLRSFEVGAAYVRSMSPASAVQPELAALVAGLEVTAHFAVLDGRDVLYLSKEDPPRARVRLASAVGMRLPAHHTAVGQAQLATFAEAEVLARLGPPPYVYREGVSGWTREAFLARLARVREIGYAIDHEETLAGIVCVAAPVFDAAGCCCGAVGASFPRPPAGPVVGEVAGPVCAAAARASQRLGHRAQAAKP